MAASATSITTPIMFIQQAQDGIDHARLAAFLQNSDLHKAELAEILNLDPKTLDNYRKQNKSLDNLRSELFLKLEEVFEVGKEVLGSKEAFRSWLHLPAGEFHGKTPWQLLSTVTGVGEVHNQLLRIAYGYTI